MALLSPVRERTARAVRRLGWAYALLHLNIHLGTLNILPSWAGYLLILHVLPVLAEHSPSARLLRPLGIFLAISDLLEWTVTLIGFSPQTTIAAQSLLSLYQLLRAAILLYFHFQLLTDVASLAYGLDYDGRAALLSARTWDTVLHTLLHLLLCLPETPRLLALFLMAANLAVAFVLCRQMLRFGRWLGQAPEQEPGEPSQPVLE